jgi:hypothetical protein
MAPNLNDKQKQDTEKKTGSVKDGSNKDKMSSGIHQKGSTFGSNEDLSSKNKKGISGERIDFDDVKENENDSDISRETKGRNAESRSSSRGGL